MNEFVFSGEESARFTRFAKCCLAANVDVDVEVWGRDPLTSRPVTISGKIVDAVLDRYMRYIVVEEPSSIKFWVAGSNSTKSVASKSVVFSVTDDQLKTLKDFGESEGVRVPRIRRLQDVDDDLLWTIEQSVNEPSDEKLELLLDSLDHEDQQVRLEAGLTLRAFSEFIKDDQTRQLDAESRVLAAMRVIQEEETLCALAENLGYFGRNQSVEFLASALLEPSSKEHVRWASAIALGRLPGTDIRSHLLDPLRHDQAEWTKAALILAISRNAEKSDRELLEPLFRELLSAESSELVLRYTSLGLSQFDRHDDETAEKLIAILGDDQLGVEARGYASLAIASGLPSYSKDRISVITRIMNSFARNNPVDMGDPEAIWGVEFLAELASILEINEVSASLNGLLADQFPDWRSGYYTCMKHYELGESAVRGGRGEEAIVEYVAALESLKLRASPVDDLPAEAAATMEFRKDIVKSRLDLQTIIRNWMDVARPQDLLALIDEIKPVYEGYRRYSTPSSNIGNDRQLVDRERLYIRNTSDLVAVIEQFIRFDHMLLTAGAEKISSDLIQTELGNLIEVIRRLGGRFRNGFAHSLSELIEKLLSDLEELDSVIEGDSKMSRKNLLRFCRQTITAVQGAFWEASWPMPGRACPVYGLGRAKFDLRTDGIQGEGTERNPFRFPANAPLVLNASVKIFDMAPGSGTRLRIYYGTGDERLSQSVPIVEGEYTCTLRINEHLPTHTPVKLDVSLEFHARDCNQKAETKSVFVIGEQLNV
jgi:hypothetical protein